MRVRISIKKICEKCHFVRRQGKFFVICEYSKHIQRQDLFVFIFMVTFIQRLSISQNKNNLKFRLGIIHIRITYNNILVTASSITGNILIWYSSGICGFHRTRKSTPFAAKITTINVIIKCIERGIQDLRIYIWGPGLSREIAVRRVFEIGFRVTLVRDITPISHNGCRFPKRRHIKIYLDEFDFIILKIIQIVYYI